MTWGSNEPHCGDPVPVTLTRRQWAYLRDLVAVEGALEPESRHLSTGPYQLPQIEAELDRAAAGRSP